MHIIKVIALFFLKIMLCALSIKGNFLQRILTFDAGHGGLIRNVIIGIYFIKVLFIGFYR